MKKLVSFGVAMLVAGSVMSMEPSSSVYAFPVVAKVSGAGDSNWATELCMTNGSRVGMDVAFAFFWGYQPQQNDPPVIPWTGPQLYEVFLTPRTTWCYPDVVGHFIPDMYNHSWRGGLLVGAEADDPDYNSSFVVTVKVTNSGPAGTYALNVAPEIDHYGRPPIHFYYQDGDDDLFMALATGIKNYGVPNVSGYRTSVGFTNFSMASNASPLKQDMAFYILDHEGSTVFSQAFVLGNFENKQILLPRNVVVDGGAIDVRVLGTPGYTGHPPSSLVLPYITVTDNRTGDGVYIPLRVISWENEEEKAKEEGSLFSLLTKIKQTVAQNRE